MPKLQGSCYCGAVTFEVEPPPRFVAHCHCGNCRRAHGAGVVTWAGFSEERLALRAEEGALGRYVTETAATRTFCRTCGSPLLYASPRWPGEVHVAVACLLDPVGVAPMGHAFADRSPEWCPITDDLPRMGGESGTEPL